MKTVLGWFLILFALTLLVACSNTLSTDVGTDTPVDKPVETDGGAETGGATEPITLTPGEHWLTVDGRERRYLVHVPGGRRRLRRWRYWSSTAGEGPPSR